jgi:hypothetical protein
MRKDGLIALPPINWKLEVEGEKPPVANQVATSSMVGVNDSKNPAVSPTCWKLLSMVSTCSEPALKLTRSDEEDQASFKLVFCLSLPLTETGLSLSVPLILKGLHWAQRFLDRSLRFPQ